MLNLKTGLVGGLLLFATAMCSTSAMATDVIATLNSVGDGNQVNMHVVNPYNNQTIGEQVLLGMETFTRTGGNDTGTLVGSGASNSFFAFCLEPYENASLGSGYDYTVAPLANADSSSLHTTGIGAAKATQISELFGQFAPNLSAAMTSVQTQALQLALWEIVSESSSNPLDITHGTTYFSTSGSDDSSALTLAQTYLNYVTSANGTGPMAQGLEALTSNGNQDMLVQVVSSAPEPGTWLMMIIGFGFIGYAMRSRRGRGAMPAYRLAA